MPRRLHPADGLPEDHKRARQVDVQDRLPRVEGGLGERRPGPHADGVDEPVGLAEVGRDPREGVGDGGLVGHVGHDREVAYVVRGAVEARHASARLGEVPGDDAPEAAVGAGHHDDAAGEVGEGRVRHGETQGWGYGKMPPLSLRRADATGNFTRPAFTRPTCGRARRASRRVFRRGSA